MSSLARPCTPPSLPLSMGHSLAGSVGSEFALGPHQFNPLLVLLELLAQLCKVCGWEGSQGRVGQHPVWEPPTAPTESTGTPPHFPGWGWFHQASPPCRLWVMVWILQGSELST